MAKLTAELSEELAGVVEELAKKQRITKTQVIRRSLALLKFLEDEKDKNHKVVVENSDGREKKEIVWTT